MQHLQTLLTKEKEAHSVLGVRLQQAETSLTLSNSEKHSLAVQADQARVSSEERARELQEARDMLARSERDREEQSNRLKEAESQRA